MIPSLAAAVVVGLVMVPMLLPLHKASRATVDCGLRSVSRDTTRFIALSNAGRRTGELLVWQASENRWAYRQRWRVDSLTVLWEGHVQADADGRPGEYETRRSVNGTVRLHDVVRRMNDSVVSVRNGRRTSLPFQQGILLSPRIVPVPAAAVLVRCAVAASDPVSIIGQGRFTIREASRITLRDGRRMQRAILFVAATDSTPDYARVWFDDSLTLLASSFTPFPGDMVIRSDWADTHHQLLSAEVAAAEARMLQTARTAGERPAAGVAFVHARVLDVEAGRARDNQSVFVEGSIIRQVVADSEFTVPSGAMVIDASGKTLLPGLIDVSTHRTNGHYWATTDWYTRDLISRGITTIQELDADSLNTPRILDRIERGAQIGPRIVPGCLIDGWYLDSINGDIPDRRASHGQVRDANEARQWIRACGARGGRVLLINDNLSPELTDVAVREARRRGMRITGNALRGRSTRELVDLGYDEIAHVFQALVPFIETRTDSAAWLLHRAGGIASYWGAGRAFATLDFNRPDIQELVNLLARRGLKLHTTLCVYPPINPARPHDRTWDTLSFAKLQEFTYQFHRRGVRILAGTDSACPLTRELQLLRQAGFTEPELLRMATIDAAQYLGLGNLLGTIEAGKRADLILSDGDPWTEIADLERLSVVMRDGLLYSNLAQLRDNLAFLPKR